MIRLERVRKVFNEGRANAFTAVDGVSLSVGGACVTVLKGPSGSGKTTLLSLIGCMARPTAGRIHLDDRELTSLPERFLTEIRRRTFGFIFQQFNLVKGITALENVLLPAYPLGQQRGQLAGQARRLFRRLGLEGKETVGVEWLSGGEMQRVAIARALINGPEVVIADEPTAHLDTRLSQEFMQIVAGLKAQGKTVLIASHDPLVCESPVVDRVIGVRDGRLEGQQ